MRRLIRTILVAGLLAASACAAGTTPTPTPTPIAPASRERSAEVAGVTVAATPERIDTTGAVVRLKLDTHTTPLDMDSPGAAHLSVGGKDWPARGWNGPGPGGHHREGTLEFSPGGPASGSVRLALDGLAEPAELTWTEVPR
jgi:hypothetical protein